MLNCELYIFQKRRNSTRRPDRANATTLDGEMKQVFSPLGLEVTFDFGPVLHIPFYNYAYIESFARYYYITDWVYLNGLWVGTFSCDVLASFKESIGGSTQYVSRAYSRYDASIIDTNYPTKADGIYRSSSILTPTEFWGADAWADNGLIVIGTVGATASNIGATTYYAMSMATARDFLSRLMGSIAWAGISVTEISEELQKALINPMQYIVSAKWFPINAAGFTQGTATTQISLGYWSFQLSGTAYMLRTVASSWITRQSEVAIPKHIQSLGDPGARLQFINMAPFSEYVFKFLPFGIFPLDSTDLFDMSYLGIQVESNLITGDAIMKLAVKGPVGSYNFDQQSILTYQSAIGVELPIAQITMDAGKWKNAISAAGFAAAGQLASIFGV